LESNKICEVCEKTFPYLIEGSFNFLTEYRRVEMCESCYGSAINLENQRKPVWHDLKIFPEYFNSVIEENVCLRKTVELRKDDRGYKVGHYLRLKEFDSISKVLTGKEAHVRITHILKGGVWLPQDYAALSILLIYPNRWES
jgi:hypothetical protein